MANVLSAEKRAAVARCLIDGCSIRATVRITGVHKTTISHLLLELGARCADLHDRVVRGVAAHHVEVDEVWSFVGKKQSNVTECDDVNHVGDCYTFIALDADTRLIIAHRVGKRTQADTDAFMIDLAARCAGRVQLSSDGWVSYPASVEAAFGRDVDYAVISKQYRAPEDRRYSPSRVSWQRKDGRVGHPDMERVCTSHVECANLSVRMRNRRFTRLTNAFSKSWEHHQAAFHLTAATHNFLRSHGALNGLTPAMAANVTDRVWEVEDLLEWDASAN